MDFNDILEKELKGFFEDEKAVIFIGAGVSNNLGLPTWRDFAYEHLAVFKNNNDINLKINFETYELLKQEDFKTIISVCKNYMKKDKNIKRIIENKYTELFKIDFDCESQKEEIEKLILEDKLILDNNELIEKLNTYRNKLNKIDKVKSDGLFKNIYNLDLINVTTNYDDIFDILAKENEKFTEEKSVFYSKEDFEDINGKVLKGGQVFHIHGSINDIKSMIISREDYIKRYYTNKVDESRVYKGFLKRIFEEYNVLFIGYSFQEIEILQYLFEADKNRFEGTSKKRILIMDAYEYEREKVDFLRAYYKDNYKVSLCCYSKSEEGYSQLNDVVEKIKKIKDKAKDRKRCSEIISNVEIKELDKIELLEKLKDNKKLQKALFNKIKGDYERWYVLLKKYKYFENENLEGVISYINSIYEYSSLIEKEDLSTIYSRIIKSDDNNIFICEGLDFILKYYNIIDNFNIKSVIEKYIEKELIEIFIRNITSNINNENVFNFIQDNRLELLDPILSQIFINIWVSYSVVKNDKLIDLYLNRDEDLFLNKVINKYRDYYINNKSNFGEITVNLEEINRMKIIRKENVDIIEFNNLKDLEDKINKKYNNDNNLLKINIKNLFNKDSWNCIFDNEYLFEKDKIKFLTNIAKREKCRNKFINLLFESEIFKLKKFAIYFIEKFDMWRFIIEKIKDRDFDFEYIFRNSEFEGELKIILEKLNSFTYENNIVEKVLYNLINKGSYTEPILGEKIEHEKWKYKRARELYNFKTIKQIKEELQAKMEYDFQLSPIIGKCDGGFVERKFYISEDNAKRMNIKEWVLYMNEFSKNPPKSTEFLKEFSIEKECELFITCMKYNLDKFFDNIEELYKIDDYEWLYYIYKDMNKLIKEENNISNYYLTLMKVTKTFLVNLNNLYEESIGDKPPKKMLINEVCKLITEIIKNNFSDCMIDEFKNIIELLEMKIDKEDDFKTVLVGSGVSYTTNLINSIHYYLIMLELNFIYKLKDKDEYSEYIKEIIKSRINKSPKEMYMILGKYLYYYLNINENFVRDITECMENLEKKMFLSGFSNYKDINSEGFKLIKGILVDFDILELEDKNARDRLIKYLILAYMLDYEGADLKIIENKQVLDKNTVQNILGLKESYKSLKEEYIYDKFYKKHLTVWKTILFKNQWDELEEEIPKSTMIALRELDGFNEEVEKIIISILKNTSTHSDISYELFDYLKRVINIENFESVEKIILEFKMDYYDYEIYEMFDKLQEVNKEKYEKFKPKWIRKNPNFIFNN